MAKQALPDTDKYPPYDYLKLLARNCPKAIHLYMDLWNMRNKSDQVVLSVSEINDIFQISKNTFRTDLRSLCREGLVSYQMSSDSRTLVVDMVRWDDENSA